MLTLQSLQRKIHSAKDLYSLVKTMKALAAVSIRQYENAVVSLDEYYKNIELGFQMAVKYRSEGINISSRSMHQKIAAIIVGSEQGMVGQFNEVISAYAKERMDELNVSRDQRYILAIGDRLSSSIDRKGEIIEEYPSLPSSFGGITAMLQDVLVRIEQWRYKQNIDQFLLFYNKPISQVAYQPTRFPLLPINFDWLDKLKKKPWPNKSVPQYTMPWKTLFASLVREHVFISLYRGFAQSLASENASRLAAMQLAEKNIEERLAELDNAYHQQRQSAITAELLEVLTGFEVMTSGKKKRQN